MAVMLTKGPRGWTQSFRQGRGDHRRTMAPQDVTPVEVTIGECGYRGFIAFGPMDKGEDNEGRGFDHLVNDYDSDQVIYAFASEVTEISGCECGNPFALCCPGRRHGG